MAKGRMGRPKIPIDYELAGKLAMIQCTQLEIAGILNVSISRLEQDKEFIRVYKEKREAGRSSLRRMQWKKAEEGNVTMLIWLGKQYLGQTDKSDVYQDSHATVNITIKGV